MTLKRKKGDHNPRSRLSQASNTKKNSSSKPLKGENKLFSGHAVAVLVIGTVHVSRMFENERFFSHLSALERELSFRTEMGLYYSYYKTIVEAPTFLDGVYNIMHCNVTEYPDTINTLKRFNLYPEVILGFMFRSYESIASYLNYQSKVCYTVNRGFGLPPVQSCEGLGELSFFYVYIIFYLSGVMMSCFFLLCYYLSGNILGGVLGTLCYFYNHGEATRVMWTPPLRESFSYPFLVVQLLVVTYTLRSVVVNWRHTAMIAVATILFMIPWQFAQFALLTQTIAMFGLYILHFLTSHKLCHILYGLAIAHVVNFIFQFGNSLLLRYVVLLIPLAVVVAKLENYIHKLKNQIMIWAVQGLLFVVGTLSIKISIAKALGIADDRLPKGTAKANVGTAKANVGTAKANVGTAKANVGTVKANVGTVKANVGTVKTNVGTVKANVGTAKANVGTVKANVGTAKANVGTAKANVGTVKANVGTVKANVGTVKANVRTVKANVGTAKANVGTAKVNVGTVKANVGTVKANVRTVKANVGTVKANVGTAKANVGTAKVNVGTAKANVGTAKANAGTAKANVGTAKANVGTAKANVHAHIASILKSKFSDYQDFHTLLYTCAPEFDFIESETPVKLSKTLVLPIAVLSITVVLYKVCSYEWQYWLGAGKIDTKDKEEELNEEVQANPKPNAEFFGFVGDKRRHQAIVVCILAIMSVQGFRNLQQQFKTTGEYNNPDMEELVEFITSRTPNDAVFAGAMPTMATVKLCTGRAVVNHPHYEDVRIRDRTHKVYQIFSRKPPQVVWDTLNSMKITHVIIDKQWCYGRP
ncbi:hypothetical protein QZH41_013409, partial [Actinostola sp. cb2023]